jgi:hypothetical protein
MTTNGQHTRLKRRLNMMRGIHEVTGSPFTDRVRVKNKNLNLRDSEKWVWP